MPQLSQLMQKLQTRLVSWVEGAVVMLPNLLVAVLVLAVAIYIARWVDKLASRLMHRISGSRAIGDLLGTVARVAVTTLGLFVALGLLNLDKTVTSLLAGVGVVGLALGFAFQDIAANFMSGVIMAIRGPFAPGDLVEVSGHLGRVKNIALRASEIETLDGKSILVPNKDIFQNAIVNYTRTPARRMDLSMGTAYADDMPTVRETVLRAVQAVPDRLPNREPELFFDSFGDSSINFTVRVWLDKSDQKTFLNARSEAMIAIKAALDAAGLTIPFPIRTLDFGANVVGGETWSKRPLRIESHSEAAE